MTHHNRRPIRSFVLRQGRLTKSQQLALEKHWAQYGLVLNQGKLNLDQLFARTSSRTLEIGFGMGHSLLTMAMQHPTEDFIGIEVHAPGVGALLAALDKQHINNIRIFKEDASVILSQCVEDESLDKIQIFFPDPWPKKRHHKRRLIQADFVRLLYKKLKPQGILHLATDWEDYADAMIDVVKAEVGFANLAGTPLFQVHATKRPTTKFESRGRRLGHLVWDLIFAKQSRP